MLPQLLGLIILPRSYQGTSIQPQLFRRYPPKGLEPVPKPSKPDPGTPEAVQAALLKRLRQLQMVTDRANSRLAKGKGIGPGALMSRR